MVLKQKTAAAMVRDGPFGGDHLEELIDFKFNLLNHDTQHHPDNLRPIGAIVLELDAKMQRAGR